MPIFADDFEVKYETSLAMHWSVQSDIHGLQMLVDGINRIKL